MAPVCGATGVWGSAACWGKGGEGGGGVVWGEPTKHWASAAGEKDPLVSVMSGQSRGVSGPEIGHDTPSERPDPPAC